MPTVTNDSSMVLREITKLGGHLIAYCSACKRPDHGSGEDWCYYKKLSSAGPSKPKKQKPKGKLVDV